jgi:uracil-DNA glycosylase family 4
VTAVVKCAPPANKPLPAERTACVPFFGRELALLSRVRVVVVLGKFAHDAYADLVGLRPRPRFAHLAECDVPDGPTVISSFHPSQQNTFTGKLTEDAFDAVFRRAREVIS